MIHKRYDDKSKLITDANELQLVNGTEVVIFCGDQWYQDVVINMEGQSKTFDELKPLVIFVAEHLSKMDCIAQQFSRDDKFAYGYEVAYIIIKSPDCIALRYYGMTMNTEFDVVFQYCGQAFMLKSFGMIKDIQPGWDTMN